MVERAQFRAYVQHPRLDVLQGTALYAQIAQHLHAMVQKSILQWKKNWKIIKYGFQDTPETIYKERKIYGKKSGKNKKDRPYQSINPQINRFNKKKNQGKARFLK